jgi:hypothetical protein
LAEFKKTEKKKRLSQEKRIEKRLMRDGMVVLESEKTLATPTQIVVEMEVTSMQLEKSNERIREKEQELAQTAKAMTTKDTELHRQKKQLVEHRHQARMRKQKEIRHQARMRKQKEIPLPP